MVFPFDRNLSVNRSNLKQHQENLKEWVRENAPLLYGKVQERIGGESVSEVPQKDLRNFIKAKPCGFRYAIELSCQIIGPPSGQKPGRLGAARWAPDSKDLEALRACRLRRALGKKLPKLRRCKSEGARTVLVQDFRFGSSDGTSLHPHPAKRNHFSTRKRRRLRRDRSSPLLAPHGG